MSYSIHKFEQPFSLGKFCLLVADQSVKYPNELMEAAVSGLVGHEMYNEYIDISLRRPYLRALLIGNTNDFLWQKFNNNTDCEYKEIELKNGDKIAGRVVLMRGGLYAPNPNVYMSKMVQDYLKKLDYNIFGTYNELIEAPMDNPWFRVVILNIDKLIFTPFL